MIQESSPPSSRNTARVSSAPIRIRSSGLIPYLALAAGAVGGLVRFEKNARGTGALKPAAAGPPLDDDPVYARYRGAIEKDTEKLE